MALNIKNQEVERLATEVARMAGETKTDAIKHALAERKQRLIRAGADPADRAARNREWLEREVWPLNPPDQRGRRLTRDEEDEILGFGPDGV